MSPSSRTVLEAKRLGIVGCKPTDLMEKIARRMADEDISALVVTDANGHLHGIISRIDILRAFVETNDWRAQTVEHFMTRNVISVMPETTIEEVARILIGHHIHRVVVVRPEEGGMRPIAVVSDTDVVNELVNDR